MALKGPRTGQPAIAEEKGAINESAIPTVQNSRATSFEGTAVDHHIPLPREKAEAEKMAPKNAHAPKTGYGATPLTRWDLFENAAVIVIPAILLTVEQGIRVAQVYYLPTPGEELPWARTISIPLHYILTSQ